MRFLILPVVFVGGWLIGYTAGMHSGAVLVRDSWQRAVERSQP